MSKRNVERRRHLKIPIGDLDNIVWVVQATSVPGAGGNTKKVFTPVLRRHMKIITKSQGAGSQGSGHERVVQGRNTGPATTHVFKCRYTSEITKELMLSFDGRYFEILGVENPDGRNEYTIMNARLTGDVDRESART